MVTKIAGGHMVSTNDYNVTAAGAAYFGAFFTNCAISLKIVTNLQDL